MKNLIRLEELAMVMLSIWLFKDLGFAWWWWLVLILSPDISMLGYLINNQFGAFCYNLFHHKGLAIILYIAGAILQNEICELVGLILFGHSSMDRAMGYGLKYYQGFKFTHLGMIGNEQNK
jgi:hypothetical protein